MRTQTLDLLPGRGLVGAINGHERPARQLEHSAETALCIVQNGAIAGILGVADVLRPQAIRIGRRSVRTIHQNLGFTAAYNVVGIALAFLGILPPVWAAAAQSLPDGAIMLNSARLLRRA